MKICLFPGSFDPFTTGHADLVSRALNIFDHVIIAIGHNTQKQGWLPVQERAEAISQLYANDNRIAVRVYEGLTIDFAREVRADAILRGVRSIKDYEYEQSIADINAKLSDIETILLPANPQLACISSSMVRELAHFGHDIKPFIPTGISYPTLQ